MPSQDTVITPHHPPAARAAAASSSTVVDSSSAPMRYILPLPVLAILLMSSGSADFWLMQMQEMDIPRRATLAACRRAYFWGEGCGAVASPSEIRMTCCLALPFG